MGESLELQAQDFPGGSPGLAYVVLLQPNGRAWGSAVKKGNLIYVYQSGGEGILGQQVKVSLAPGVPSIPYSDMWITPWDILGDTDAAPVASCFL